MHKILNQVWGPGWSRRVIQCTKAAKKAMKIFCIITDKILSLSLNSRSCICARTLFCDSGNSIYLHTSIKNASAPLRRWISLSASGCWSLHSWWISCTSVNQQDQCQRKIYAGNPAFNRLTESMYIVVDWPRHNCNDLLNILLDVNLPCSSILLRPIGLCLFISLIKIEVQWSIYHMKRWAGTARLVNQH